MIIVFIIARGIQLQRQDLQAYPNGDSQYVDQRWTGFQPSPNGFTAGIFKHLRMDGFGIDQRGVDRRPMTTAAGIETM